MRIVKILGLLAVALLLFIHFYAPRFITEVRNPVIQILSGRNKVASIEPTVYQAEFMETISLVSYDGLQLSAVLTRASSDENKGTIILLHGIRGSNAEFLPMALRLREAGYQSVALDLRAHGKSEGVHTTFGVKEKRDVSVVVDYLLDRFPQSSKIGIWGRSLGGSIALQSLGNDRRLSYGIVESSFSEFRTITHDYTQRYLGFNLRPVTNYLIDRSGTIAGFTPEDASPYTYSRMIEQPILVVHGDSDNNIAIDYGRKNYHVIPSTQKQFLEVENADHYNVWTVGGDRYWNTVAEFLKNQAD